VTFTVSTTADITAPVATITKPANGSTVINNVTITANASDNVGVTRMELYVDGALKSTASIGSISWTWNTKKVAAGTHVIMVKAYDAAGNTGTVSSTVYK
jgi:hypothetical protein